MTVNQRLLIAGRELIKGNVDVAVKSLTAGDDFMNQFIGGVYQGVSFTPDTYTSQIMGDNSSWIYTVDGNGSNYFQYSGLADATTAYVKCPPFAAVINRKAAAYTNGTTFVLDKNGKEVDNSKVKNLKKLLKQPNILQNWTEFEAQNYIYQQVYGFAIVFAPSPVGWDGALNATALWNVPPSAVKIYTSKKLFYQTDIKSVITKIELTYEGQTVELPLENVYIIRDFVPNANSFILPSSRVSVLTQPINNVIGAYESRNVLINYRGALGIISQDSGGGNAVSAPLPMTKEQKEELQNDFRRYGLKNRQIQFIITKASLKWQQMGYPTKELMLFEEVQDGMMAICDQYGYPYRLMSNISSNSLGGTDAQIFGKMLYQDTIIPESKRIGQQWDKIFGLDELEYHFNKDYSHIPVLQDDSKLMADARLANNEAMKIEWENGLITRNQWRVSNGDDPVSGDDLYITDKKEKEPLAVKLGSTGVQSVIAILGSSISPEAKQAALEILFGITPADAERLTVEPEPATQPVDPNNPEDQTQNPANPTNQPTS